MKLPTKRKSNQVESKNLKRRKKSKIEVESKNLKRKKSEANNLQKEKKIQTPKSRPNVLD